MNILNKTINAKLKEQVLNLWEAETQWLGIPVEITDDFYMNGDESKTYVAVFQDGDLDEFLEEKAIDLDYVDGSYLLTANGETYRIMHRDIENRFGLDAVETVFLPETLARI
jgi:hypothetical protein